MTRKKTKNVLVSQAGNVINYHQATNLSRFSYIELENPDVNNLLVKFRNVLSYEIIRPRDLPFVTGLSRTTCWRLSNDPESGFPPKIRLSAGAVGYSKKAIELWLKSREEV